MFREALHIAGLWSRKMSRFHSDQFILLTDPSYTLDAMIILAYHGDIKSWNVFTILIKL